MSKQQRYNHKISLKTYKRQLKKAPLRVPFLFLTAVEEFKNEVGLDPVDDEQRAQLTP